MLLDLVVVVAALLVPLVCCGVFLAATLRKNNRQARRLAHWSVSYAALWNQHDNTLRRNNDLRAELGEARRKLDVAQQGNRALQAVIESAEEELQEERAAAAKTATDRDCWKSDAIHMAERINGAAAAFRALVVQFTAALQHLNVLYNKSGLSRDGELAFDAVVNDLMAVADTLREVRDSYFSGDFRIEFVRSDEVTEEAAPAPVTEEKPEPLNKNYEDGDWDTDPIYDDDEE
jgi:septal ring factor EnvC (AmiA/AmiB activator)